MQTRHFSYIINLARKAQKGIKIKKLVYKFTNKERWEDFNKYKTTREEVNNIGEGDVQANKKEE